MAVFRLSGGGQGTKRAAMSLGRTSTFIDIYAQRDLDNGVFTEEQIQELIDHFIMKLRLVKFARTPETTSCSPAIRPGLPNRSRCGHRRPPYGHQNLVPLSAYAEESRNGTGTESDSAVVCSPADELQALLRQNVIESSSIQYENDDLMRVTHGDDYTIACCVSSMRIGKEMQFFGARANLAKCLLYAINGGVDEISKKQVGPEYRPITSEYLDYDEVMHNTRR